MKKNLFVLVLLLGLGACKAKVDDAPSVTAEPPAGKADTTKVEPTLACISGDPVNGQLEGQEWKLKSGVAFASAFKDMWDVTLYDEPSADPCREFGSAKGISLRVPMVTGEFDLQDPRAAVFYDLNPRPTVSLSTLNGRGQIDEITSAVIRGSIEAYVDAKTGACGKFEVTRCQ